MKARKLVQDQETKKQNIVWFGSYGYEKEYIDIDTSINGVVLAEDIVIPDIITFNAGATVYMNQIYLNLCLRPRDPDEPGYANWIRIESDDPGASIYYIMIQCNVLISDIDSEGKNINRNVTIELGSTCSHSGGIPVDSIINKIKEEYGSYITATNFIFTIISSTSFTPNTFSINYPTKKSKLAYDKDQYGPNNPYTYLESQLFDYSTKGLGVKDGLIPRLSVIKGELWYKASYGLPLMEKIKSKGIFDSIIVRYITDYPDVANLEYFSSIFDEHNYTFDCTINTIYNEKINLSYKL